MTQRAAWPGLRGPVFIDETGFLSKMACPRGMRSAASSVVRRFRPGTRIPAALTLCRLIATATINGSVTGAAFLAYLEQMLVLVAPPG